VTTLCTFSLVATLESGNEASPQSRWSSDNPHKQNYID
jgi:hypothetical protein